jgi:hypothetical protein
MPVTHPWRTMIRGRTHGHGIRFRESGSLPEKEKARSERRRNSRCGKGNKEENYGLMDGVRADTRWAFLVRDDT